VQSPNKTSAIEGQSRALATVIACARAETEAPLLQRIQVLEKALARESAERQNLDHLVDELEAELAARDLRLEAHAGAARSLLIMPGQ